MFKSQAVLIGFLIIMPATVGCAQAEEVSYPTVGAAITSASEIQQNDGRFTSKLEVLSSDPELVTAFDRARRQAMAFVYEDDPVGPWYEAAEPGREAFCMRDVAHQAMGAHALGLVRHNLNMLRRFAAAVSDSKDWCSYWEIDRYGRAAPVDYEDDANFWYNLPANFDVLDCCYRMYVWTGDLTYINDPAFVNFYDRTVNDYVERWGLELDQVMQRPRLLNVRGMIDPARKKFQANRGIPGYNEQDPNFVLGFDVLANQYAAYVAYARIQEARREMQSAQAFLKKAVDLKDFLYSTWWNAREQCFYGFLNGEYKLKGRGPSGLQPAHDFMSVSDPDAMYDRMLERARPGRSRWDYPEVPYSWIGDFVNGLMGITIEAAPAGLSAQQGYWVAAVVKTQPALGSRNEWTELSNLPFRANELTVRHDSGRKTTLTNQHGPAVIWQATFPGTYETLFLNGHPQRASAGTDAYDREISSLRVTISGGATASVEIPR